MSYQPPHLRTRAAPPPPIAAGPSSSSVDSGRGGRGLGVGGRWLETNSNGPEASRGLGGMTTGAAGMGMGIRGRGGSTTARLLAVPSRVLPERPSAIQAPRDEGRIQPQPSRRDWSAPTSSVSLPGRSQPAFQSAPLPPYASPRRVPGGQGLQAPASDIKPMRVREKDSKEKEEEREMEMVQSVSRSGGDGAQGDALKDWGTQDRYRAYISTRVDAHYDKYATLRDEAPSKKGKELAGEGEGEEMESLGSIVLLFLFESSAKFALLAQNKAQLLSSLSGLVPGLYQAHDNLPTSSSPDDTLSNQLNALSLTPRDGRTEFTVILLIFHLVTRGHVAFNELHAELTRAPRSEGDGGERKGFVGEEELGYVRLAARVMAEETFDSVTFFRLLSPLASTTSTPPIPSSVAPEGGRLPESTSYQRILLSRASPAIRDRAWERLKKAYMSVGVDWAGKVLGLELGGEVEKWVEEKGGRVEAGKVVLR
ncbi:hypothetical protein L198_06575 [Cryptococcus wingfieldii CBS 7118]|uniref:Uncharacterized protein n=1 Tax=Cryptococcus wingfieldii CBS 7118 TaxID=1295528 RepID=A0A1E3IJK7_9TREE|nr:hypothetical protein L198_06575 [Cryptococcus wingfieldii CBS 7118]ODN88773.1 hypothetical protein L198_06575 [Cryptococcus wingfieldii CBS 7118]